MTETRTTVRISPNWLRACGREHMIGHDFPVVRVDERASYSAMGNCLIVELPDGVEWTVFSCRLATETEAREELSPPEQRRLAEEYAEKLRALAWRESE